LKGGDIEISMGRPSPTDDEIREMMVYDADARLVGVVENVVLDAEGRRAALMIRPTPETSSDTIVVAWEGVEKIGDTVILNIPIQSKNPPKNEESRLTEYEKKLLEEAKGKLEEMEEEKKRRVEEAPELENHVISCRNCGATTKPENKFCSNCGARLIPSTTPEYVPPPPEHVPPPPPPAYVPPPPPPAYVPTPSPPPPAYPSISRDMGPARPHLFGLRRYILGQKAVRAPSDCDFEIKDSNGNTMGSLKRQSRSNNYWFEDLNGNKVGRVERKRRRAIYSIYDSSGRLRGSIEKKRWTLTPTYKIKDPNGNEYANFNGVDLRFYARDERTVLAEFIWEAPRPEQDAGLFKKLTAGLRRYAVLEIHYEQLDPLIAFSSYVSNCVEKAREDG